MRAVTAMARASDRTVARDSKTGSARRSWTKPMTLKSAIVKTASRPA